MTEAGGEQTLIGKKIVSVRPMNLDEVETFGWERSGGMVIVLENDTKIIPSRDEEGNGPGCVFIDEGTEDISVLVVSERGN